MAYIRYGNIAETLQRINRGIRSGGIITLTGAGGVGKSRMLEQYVLEASRTVGSDQIVLVQMARPNRKFFGKDRIVTPPAMAFFSRLWYVIQKMSRLTYQEWLETLDQRPARHYTGGDFLGLHANIAEAISQLHIALVIGDNIEHIDGVTFDWLIQLWQDCQQQFAIVLWAELKPNAALDEPFKDLWSHISKDMHEYRVDELMLDHMSRESFVEVVLPELLNDLNADFDSHVALSGLLWQRTQGNWHSLTRLITFLDEELTQDKRNPRIITQDVVKRVFERR
jgi:hypothetical protein